MLPGVRPSISLASRPTASTRPLILLIATIEGSLTTMPLPRAYTQVLAVPRSIARSLEKREKTERRLTYAPCAAEAAPYRRITPKSRCENDAVLASVLHAVHGRIGRLEQLLRRGGNIRQRGHANRRGQVNVQPVGRLQERIRRNPLAHALGHGDSA